MTRRPGYRNTTHCLFFADVTLLDTVTRSPHDTNIDEPPFFLSLGRPRHIRPAPPRLRRPLPLSARHVRRLCHQVRLHGARRRAAWPAPPSTRCVDDIIFTRVEYGFTCFACCYAPPRQLSLLISSERACLVPPCMDNPIPGPQQPFSATAKNRTRRRCPCLPGTRFLRRTRTSESGTRG